MKTQLLSTLQTLKSVHSRSKGTKYDSLLSNAMDLPVENASCKATDDGENEFTNGFCNNQGETVEAKQSSNVNSSPPQWPLRHNNDNESPERHNSYSCNGFPQAKKPRYTYKGRISRIPSRYLDTDSDSGDGSVRKDGQNRLKIKRHRRIRKLPCNTSKLLANGFKQREDGLLLPLKGFEVDTITDEQECFANVEYPDVFENTSPISYDKISHVAHETLDGNESHPNPGLSNKIMRSETSQTVAVASEATGVDNFISKSKQKAQHSLTSSCCCVDISSKNNASPCFESLMEPRKQTTTETHHVDDQSLETFSTMHLNRTCKRKSLQAEDSSATETVVSSIEISKHCQVSCAIHNGSKKCNNCVENNECESFGKISSDTSKKKRLVKTNRRSSDQPALQEGLNNPQCNLLHPQTEGLKCLKDLKMRKVFAKKLKQKQLRRSEKPEKNDVLKKNWKNGVICKVKQRVFGKLDVGKMGKKSSKVNRSFNKVTKIKAAGVTRPSQPSQDLDRVLGMRQNATAVYEFLVQWKNGTSCWVSSDDVVTNKHNHHLREYLVESEQDVSVVNRVPFQAYCCDSLSLKECKNTPKSKKALRKMLCVDENVEKTVCSSPVISVKKQQHDVAVKYEQDICYVTVNRETCKRKKTCLKIMGDLITALEDAATSSCEAVVVHGLQSDVLYGLKLDDMSKTGVEKENIILSQARYLVQTLTNYPKLLIALVSQPSHGISAMLLSLFDMICDKETWENKQILDTCEKETNGTKNVYTLPRLTGHSLLGEEILMGKHNEDLERFDDTSAANVERTDTSAVTSTLAEIEANLRVLGKKTSLHQFNGEISELFPSSEPSFALFSDIESDAFPENDNDGCLNDLAERSDTVANDHNLSGCAVDETSEDHESNQCNQNVSGTNNDIALLMEHTEHPPKVDDQNHHSVVHTITDESVAEQVINNQVTINNVIGDPSTTKSMNQTTEENTNSYTNVDHPNIHDKTHRETSDERNTEVTTLECISNESKIGQDDSKDVVIGHSPTTVLTASSCRQGRNNLSEELDDNEVLDSTVTEQTSRTTDTCTVTESIVDNALNIDYSLDGIAECELGNHAADTISANNNEFLTNNNALEAQSNYTDCSLNDTGVTIDSNEHNPKDTFIKDAYDNICETRLRTDHARTDEFGENKQHKLKTVENDVSNQCTANENTANENSQKYDISIDNIGKLVPIMQINEDNTSEKDVNVVADDDKTPKDSDFLSRTENNTNVIYTSDSFEMKEAEKLNDQINEFVAFESISSNSIEPLITNVDTNCYKTTDDSITDLISGQTAEHKSMGNNYCSPAAADERYLRNLQTKIETEKAQTKKLIGEFSRLWDNPFLCKNKL